MGVLMEKRLYLAAILYYSPLLTMTIESVFKIVGTINILFRIDVLVYLQSFIEMIPITLLCRINMAHVY